VAANPDGVWNEAGAAFAFSLAPHIYETWLFRSGCTFAVLLAVAGVIHRRLTVQQRIHKLEQQTALAEERARIARDLHDDLGASLTNIAFLSAAARDNLANPASAEPQVNRISDIAGQVVDDMGNLVWSTNPKYDSLQNLVAYLREHAARFFDPTNICCRLDFPSAAPELHLGSEFRRNLFLVLKESLNNILKHAEATEVEVRLAVTDDRLEMTIADNGCGLGDANRQSKIENRKSGNGLPNMRQRIEALGGKFDWQSSPDAGTRITASVPLPKPS
jgi:signal transduction histidine kinase